MSSCKLSSFIAKEYTFLKDEDVKTSKKKITVVFMFFKSNGNILVSFDYLVRNIYYIKL